jgi:ATPase family associated with various cellular activities (AAA)/Winged helix domain, variant
MTAVQTTEDRAVINSDQTAADLDRASVLDLVARRVRLRAHRRIAWLAHLWGHPIADTFNSFDAIVRACLDDRDTPEAESAWFDSAEEVQPLNDRLFEVERALAGAAGDGLQQLAEMFRLSLPEMDLLQTCMAPAVDPALGAVNGYLQFHAARSYATEPLAARLFGYGRSSLWSPGCPLASWGLVTAGEAAQGEPAPLAVDRVVIDWLQGELRMDEALVGMIRAIPPRAPLENWPVGDAARLAQRGIDHGSLVRLLLVGPPSSGRRTFAADVAAKFGIQALGVDTTGISDSNWPDTFMRAQRLAVLGGAALVWHGGGLHRRWPNSVAPGLIQFVACDLNQVIPPCEYAIDHSIELPAPTLDERRKLWKANVAESAAWPVDEFETLVGRYRLNAGDIVSASRRGPASSREAAGYARELTRHQLGELARLLDCPFTWDDLVVHDRLREALEDFAFEARDRAAFWESPNARRLFPRGAGLVALFNGPPGTGKTMAAQVIAAELELDLFRVDLATVVSKYIGETAKHLGQIFARAAQMNAVLFFDEADALFSKRIEVRDSLDRHANADTSYLLQLLEEYRGIVILASNKKQNIDHAFCRRMRYVFDFPRPDQAERRKIWRQVIGELSGGETLSRLEATIEALAATIEISGAQIKNAVLAAIFIARRNREPLAMRHLLSGVERELSKEGRSLGANERERLARYA